MSYRKLSGLDYRDFHRNVNGDLVHNSRIRKPITWLYESADNKVWSVEEKAFLYDLITVKGVTHFSLVQQAFIAQGYKDLRPVHVDIAKRHVDYNDREGYISGKHFSAIAERNRRRTRKL